MYGGVSYEGCTSDTYSWCALSTDSYGNYIDWAYCGYGNSNEDHCVFPFVYGGVEYNTCTDSWCATSAYENTKEYYSYKYCDADELALGLTTFDYGAGTTVTGEECVPMIYSGANYLKCTSNTDSYSWCATSTDTSGNYVSWEYCGYGNSTSGDLAQCVPMVRLKIEISQFLQVYNLRSTVGLSTTDVQSSPPAAGVPPLPTRTAPPTTPTSTARRRTGPPSPTPSPRRRPPPWAAPATETRR